MININLYELTSIQPLVIFPDSELLGFLLTLFFCGLNIFSQEFLRPKKPIFFVNCSKELSLFFVKSKGISLLLMNFGGSTIYGRVKIVFVYCRIQTLCDRGFFSKTIFSKKFWIFAFVKQIQSLLCLLKFDKIIQPG